MLRVFRCDLHLHSCLSPCADLEMSPKALVRQSLAARLDAIAVCDHNASENVRFVQRLAEGTGLKVLPGMEITSSEEVHLIALFDGLEDLLRLQDVVYAHLPGQNDERIFGCQAIVNDQDEVEGLNDRLLIGATTLPLNELIDQIHLFGGLAIASHIDRESFSVIGQLGFIDPHAAFDALEVSARMGIGKARQVYPDLAAYAMLTSSDAHVLRDIGLAATGFRLEDVTIPELRLAFMGHDGRGIVE